MKSSSLKMIASHGISTPRHYRDSIIHDWYLPLAYQDYLAVHQLRAINHETLFKAVKEGMLVYGSRNYNIMWLNGPSKIRTNPRVLISFRYCPIMDQGYCLIKTLYEQNSNIITDYNTNEFKDLKLIAGELHDKA